MKLGSMKAPWGDQVKGSWWKALLIVIVYFVLRVMFESWMYAQGALKVTAEPTLDMLSLIHISEPTRRLRGSRMPSSA